MFLVVIERYLSEKVVKINFKITMVKVVNIKFKHRHDITEILLKVAFSTIS